MIVETGETWHLQPKNAEPLDIGLDPNAPAVFPRNFHFPRDADGIKELAHLVRLQDRRDADLPAESRPLDEERRIIGNDLLDDQPVEQSPQRRQVLFDGRSGERLPLDIGGDMQRPDGGKLQLILLAPAEELRRGLHVRLAHIRHAVCGGEEFEEMFARLVSGIGDDGRHGNSPGEVGRSGQDIIESSSICSRARQHN